MSSVYLQMSRLGFGLRLAILQDRRFLVAYLLVQLRLPALHSFVSGQREEGGR